MCTLGELGGINSVADGWIDGRVVVARSVGCDEDRLGLGLGRVVLAMAAIHRSGTDKEVNDDDDCKQGEASNGANHNIVMAFWSNYCVAQDPPTQTPSSR